LHFEYGGFVELLLVLPIDQAHRLKKLHEFDVLKLFGMTGYLLQCPVNLLLVLPLLMGIHSRYFFPNLTVLKISVVVPRITPSNPPKVDGMGTATMLATEFDRTSTADPHCTAFRIPA